jgi:hypothetical protein
VDTGVIRIEEVRGPDQLPDHQKLQSYLREGDDIAQRSLAAATGDQGNWHCQKQKGCAEADSDLLMTPGQQLPAPARHLLAPADRCASALADLHRI